MRSRRHPIYAWRVLSRGVCDGCALGTSGHARLDDRRHAPLQRAPAAARAEHARRARHGACSATPPRCGSSARPGCARSAGSPTRCCAAAASRASRGSAGTRRSNSRAAHLAAAPPERIAAFLTSRGMPNESYYAAQKAIRALGSPNVDNAARVCHSPSAHALRGGLGVTASTCSYTDLIGSDLVVFIGANPANNQPVTMKYLLQARREGTRVVCVNPHREPGHGALLGAVGSGERALRDAHDRPLVRGRDRRRPAVPRRRAEGDRRATAGSRAASSTSTPTATTTRSPSPARRAGRRSRAAAGCRAQRWRRSRASCTTRRARCSSGRWARRSTSSARTTSARSSTWP